MRSSVVMCFSSSVICLLIVTSQGSILPDTGHQEEDDAHRLHNTSHFSGGNSTEQKHPKNTLFEGLKVPDHGQENVVPPSSPDSVSDISGRKRRASGTEFVLPLPKVRTTHVQRRDSHPDHTHPIKSDSSKHNHHHHSLNDTDSSSDRDESVADFDDSQKVESGGVDKNHNFHHPDEDHHDHPYGQKTTPSEDEHRYGNIVSCDPANHEELADNGHDHGASSTTADLHQHFLPNNRSITGREWLYASLAVVAISLCGLISVAVIPIMQKWFYHTLLQFLVGLAIGSLSGDGLLHLMPHAILSDESSHRHEDGSHHKGPPPLQSMEKFAIWRGLAALGGIFLFFIAERLLGAITAYRRQKREAKLSSHPKSAGSTKTKEEGANNGNVGEKLAQPKKNSYDHIRDKDEKETIQMLQTEGASSVISRGGSTQSVHEVGFHGRSSFSLEPDGGAAYRESDGSVIASEHHGHGHSHEVPQSVTAVAWMVIMGDGLHNFCDGLAIGAAFASGDADGISTTVAVFCHELPHELGDFAMLLRTGMRVREALFYNAVSSVLCFVGMVIGVSLGNVHSALGWVFAGTAGMFLYIALVDMLPELTTTNGEPAALSTLAVQVLGICIGISVMLLIALYEHELHSIVS